MSARLSYSLKSAAEATGLSESHLKQVIGKGLLKAKRTAVDAASGEPAGKYIIFARDLEAYLTELVDA